MGTQSAPKATLYYDLVSQPSRALYIFQRLAGLNLQLCKVAIARGGTKSPEFLRFNPLGKVPCLVLEGVGTVCESATIFRFLADTRSVADHWYPTSPYERAQISSILDWHHSNVRLGVTLQVWNRVLARQTGGGSAALDRFGQQKLKQALQELEAVWLQRGKAAFLGGRAQLSVADLLLATELEQLLLLDASPQGPNMDKQLQAFPMVRHWLERVRKAGGDAYAEAHGVLPRAVKALQATLAKL